MNTAVALERSGDISSRLATPVSAASTAEEALDRVRQLTDSFRKQASTTESQRKVSESSIAVLSDAGLFGIVMPKVFGGSQLGFEALIKITAEISASCGSTGWVYGVLAGHSWLLNLFPVKAQEEVFADTRALTSTVFRMGGSTTRVDGGYRLVGGEGRFCSGIDHARWVIVGNTVIGADGDNQPGFFLIPRSDIEVIDDWFTVGMRGTGSRSIRIADAFIPSHRFVSMKELASGTSEGAAFHRSAFYRMPFTNVGPFSIVGAPLGMARGLVDEFTKGLTTKLSDSGPQAAERASVTLARVGEASVTLDAAMELVLANARFLDQSDPSDLTAQDRVRSPRDWSFAVQTSRRAANQVYEVAGGSAIYDGSGIQRLWRDVNSASQHIAFTQDDAMVNYGRVKVGLEPYAFVLPKAQKK